MKILELKRHLNKPEESYLCNLQLFVVVRIVSSVPKYIISKHYTFLVPIQNYLIIVFSLKKTSNANCRQATFGVKI